MTSATEICDGLTRQSVDWAVYLSGWRAENSRLGGGRDETKDAASRCHWEAALVKHQKDPWTGDETTGKDRCRSIVRERTSQVGIRGKRNEPDANRGCREAAKENG